MKSMLPAAVICLAFGLIFCAVVGCDKDNTDETVKAGKKLKTEIPDWGKNALNQITGPSSRGDILVSDGTNWHLKSIGTAGQVLTITTNANAYYVEWK